ncbi:PPE domain-containing protein [Nocardia gipuzkoensis]
MTEPPQAGFTGTIWEALPAERLAHELTTGPGGAPMSGAAIAYAELAAALASANTEFRVLLALVANAWGSESSADGLAQLAGLSDWFDEITAAATDNASVAARQAASYELAKLAMPPVAEVTAAVRVAESMLAPGPLGPPLAGLFDLAEHQLDGLRAQAARVMRTYEAEGTEAATPWSLGPAPAVSAGANLLAEQAKTRQQLGQPAAPTAHVPTEVVAPPALSVDVSAQAYLAPPPPTIPVTGESLLLTALPQPGVLGAPAPSTTTVTTTQVPSTVPPIVPTAPAPVAAQPTARAAAADDGDLDPATIPVEAGFATAPPVLGANARRVETQAAQA